MADRLRSEAGLFVFTMRMDRTIYEKLMRLKISRGDTGSFNRWLNKVMGDVVHEHQGEISGYSVDVDNTDF